MSHLKTLMVIATVCATASGVMPVHAAHYRVYLLGGQSNANGRGDASELTAPLASPQTDVRFYWHKTQVTPNGNLTQDAWLDLQPDSGHGVNSPSSFTNEFGSELSFGRTIADSNASVNVAIIKYSHGGTDLANNWAASGAQYTTFVSTVQAGLAALTDVGHTYEMGGMVWIQGENDAGSTNKANQYATNLSNLIERVRGNVFGGQTPGGYTLPFIISGLSDSQYGNITTLGTGTYIVRQAQEAVAASGRQTAFVIPMGFLPTPGRSTSMLPVKSQSAKPALNRCYSWRRRMRIATDCCLMKKPHTTPVRTWPIPMATASTTVLKLRPAPIPHRSPRYFKSFRLE